MKTFRAVNLAVLLVLAVLLSSTTASVLSNLAANLPARSFEKVPANASLSALGMESSLMYWNNSGVWDPIRKQVRWMGGPGSCCAATPTFKLVTYNEATDTWTLISIPYTGSGHGYDGNAINPKTGTQYFGQFGQAQIRVWNGTGWGSMPGAPITGTTPALAWFPELNSGNGGLVFLGDDGKLAWCDLLKWTTLPTVQTGGYNTFAEYNPVSKVVWIGGSGHYRINAQLQATQLKSAPFSLANSRALQSVDPVSGKYIVTNQSDGSFREYDIMADSWLQLSGLKNAPDFTTGSGEGNNQFQVPISDYGVIMYVDHNSNPPAVYLYKHTASGNSVETGVSSNVGFSINACPNPFRSNPLITLEGAGKTAQVSIFDLNGRLLHTGNYDRNAFVWKTTGIPSGVYLVKAVSGNKTVQKRILLER